MDILTIIVVICAVTAGISLLAAMAALKGNIATQQMLLNYMDFNLEFSRTVLKKLEGKGGVEE